MQAGFRIEGGTREVGTGGPGTVLHAEASVRIIAATGDDRARGIGDGKNTPKAIGVVEAAGGTSCAGEELIEAGTVDVGRGAGEGVLTDRCGL